MKISFPPPSLCFNEKEGLQRQFLKTLTGRDLEPNAIFIPSKSAYIEAILRGLGWGMLPDFIFQHTPNQHRMMKLFPDSYIATNLYWHRWNTRIMALDKLTECVRYATQKHLKQGQ